MVEWLPEHTEPSKEGARPVRGIYLLPNLLTTAALFAGFYAIVQSISGRFDHAALAVFIAGLLDGLDGRIARLMNAQSNFGKEYDSLSDVISFGVAPALMVYVWTLHALGGLGQAIAFAYLICVAMRLARYNSRDIKGGHLHFAGLASPASAVFLSSLTWFGTGFPSLSHTVPGQWFVCLVTALISMLTVLNIPYRSFKEVDFRGRVPFVYVLAIAFIFISIAINPPTMLVLFSGIYALSGPLDIMRQSSTFTELLKNMAGQNRRTNTDADTRPVATKSRKSIQQTKASARTSTARRSQPAHTGSVNGVSRKQDEH